MANGRGRNLGEVRREKDENRQEAAKPRSDFEAAAERDNAGGGKYEKIA